MTRAGDIYQFGPFRLDGDAGILFRDDEPALLGQRPVALLRRLLDHPGAPVSKDELIATAWNGRAVEDSNLTVQIAALRRVFADAASGEHWIETLPRRGYRYVGPPVTVASALSMPPLRPAPALPDRPSVAVMAFANLNDDPEQEYFADGMVDDIITALSRIKWLFVIARNSSFSYRGRAVDVKQVGRELGVHYVLEGSVRKASDRVRISVQLIDTTSGANVWAERYDRRFGDIFALQDEIASSIVGAMEPSLRRAEVDRVKRKRPDSLDAYDLVLRAQSDIYSGMPDESAKGLVLLRAALSLDPTYALAHAFSAMGYHNRYLRAGLHEDDRQASVRHAQAAIAHGQDDALALTLAGFSMGMDAHDRDAAFTAVNAALSIGPSTALAHILGSVLHGWAGQADDAIAWAERGLRLSPFDPWSFAAHHSVTLGHFQRADFAAAAQAAYRGVQANPGHSISYMLLAAPLAKLGRIEEANAAAARVVELQPSFAVSRHFTGVACAPALAASLSEALRVTDLPQ